MSTLSPVVQIHLGKPLPPEAFLDRVYDELHRDGVYHYLLGH